MKKVDIKDIKKLVIMAIVLIFAFIFLYKLSTSNGTVKSAVGFVSCKSDTMCFKPWHTLTEAPTPNGSKNPIEDS